MDSLLPLGSSSSSSTSTFTSSSQPNPTLVSFPFMLTIKNLLSCKMMVSNENMQEFCYLQNGGGFEVALMENAASFLAPLASNPTFLSAIFALFLTQSTKLFLNFFDKKQWNFRIVFASQGMPSTRSALSSALTTSVAISHGVAHPLFPVSLGLSLIVMCDAVVVTRRVGYQVAVVNRILDEMFGVGSPVLTERLEDDLGDTLPQLFTGALLGSTVAVLCYLGFMMLR